jgi:serine protease Do
LKRVLVASGASAAILAGAVAAQTLMPNPAGAQEIQAPAIAPPRGAPGSFAELIERVRPAVVSIQVRQRPSSRNTPSFEGLPPGWEDFFRGPGRAPREAPTALGSGFFINQNGTIVTNNHVVEDAEEIRVHLSDGRELSATLVGSDELTDLAVLRVEGGGRFPFVTFDRTAELRVGDWVVAVGNPFGLEGTATAGIVSATGRRDFGAQYVDYLQIDAPINRGNSGGPTFDLRGRVVGVNSAIFSPTGGNVGIGFAIPSDTAARVIDQLLEHGRVSRGWLGVTVQPLDNDIARSLGLQSDNGALVASVVPDSPAARAGLQQGDVILTLDGQQVEDSRQLTQRVGATAVGRTSRMEIQRNGQRRTVNVRLAERPSQEVLASAASPTPTPRIAPQPPSTTQNASAATLGLLVRPLTDQDRQRLSLQSGETGLMIVSVTPNTDLSRKFVRPGHVIVTADGHPVRTSEELAAAAERARRANRPVLLQVLDGRNGRRFVAADTSRG